MLASAFCAGAPQSGIAQGSLLDAARVAALEVREGQPESDPILGTLSVSADVSVSYRFTITSKGNGVLFLPGIAIRLYDAHDDGLVFEDDLLKNAAIDLDGDGFLDIVVWGNAISGDDELDDAPRHREPIVAVLHFDAIRREFRVTFASTSIYTFSP